MLLSRRSDINDMRMKANAAAGRDGVNIFYLHEDAATAARHHMDKHVVKMILEYAQLMSTAHRLLDGALFCDTASDRAKTRWRHPDKHMDAVLYGATHRHHPSSLWVRATRAQTCLLYTSDAADE